MQKIITLDSTILNYISLCERLTKYKQVDGIGPLVKGEALERGDLMHKLLEVYESLRCNLVDANNATWLALQEAAILHPLTDDAKLIKEFAITAGRYFATKMDLAPEEIEATIFQFSEYIDYYASDPWETLALESVGSKLMYESDDLKILYTFKIDRLAQRDKIIAPWDYKTSKKRADTSSISNQFIGYAWATDSHYVVVDKIGFQKTLSREERFQRIFLSYDDERIAEWLDNSIGWAFKYANLLEHPEFSTMNLTSCDKYSGCQFRPICEKSPSARQWIIERDYQVSERWDPAKALESEAK